MADKQHQRDHQCDSQHGRDERDALGHRPEDLHGIRDPGDLGKHLGQSARKVQRAVLQQIGYADRGDHHRHSRRVAQRFVGSPLDQKSQQHRDDQHQRDGKAQRKGCGEKNHKHAGHHEHVAVGEVDQAQDAVDHRIADGDQSILASHGDAGQQIWQGCLQKLHSDCLLTDTI